MDLYAGNTYWDKTESPAFRFQTLKEDREAQVLVVGAGMSGTLCANTMARQGLKVTVVEKGRVACGSSSANTGLLQYCSDKSISEFKRDIGEEKAVLFYRMCLEAMDHLTALEKTLEGATGYLPRNSIQYASDEKDFPKLQADYALFQKYGFPAELLNRAQLKERYQIDKPGAIRTWHDAEVNPYRFIQALTRQNIELGVSYFEETEVELENINSHSAKTKNGATIYFQEIVLSTGYTHVYPIIKEKSVRSRTYAFSSAPITGKLWKDDVMMWETKMPYLYFRTTPDNRIIAGGKDEKIDEVEKNEEKIREINEKIAAEIKELLPDIEDIPVQYSWDALFYGSKDGLPFIGSDPDQKNKYYLLGYEGNGTCYSMAGSLLLTDLIQGKENRYQHLLRLTR